MAYNALTVTFYFEELVMNTATLTVGLPDRLAEEVREAGFLAPSTFARVMREALRRQAFDDLIHIMKTMEVANVSPMTMDEIQAEVDAARARIREREKHDQR